MLFRSGVNAEVLFSGLTPGFIGLYQINMLMPAGLASRRSAPLVVSIGGLDAPPKVIATR